MNTENTKTENALATQSQFEQVLNEGTMILSASELSVSKAVSAGEKLIAMIDESGMNADLDEKCNNYLVKIRTTKGKIEDQRKPITSFFDSVRKKFTALEADVDASKPDSIPAKIQEHRNKYVKILKDAEAAAAKLAAVKLAKESELIKFKSDVQKELSLYVQSHVTLQQNNFQSTFNGITLDTFEAKSKNLKAFTFVYKKEHFDAFLPQSLTFNLTLEERSSVVNAVLAENDFALIQASVNSEMKAFIKGLVDRLPSLKTSLEEFASANVAEQKRLADEKAEREAKAAADIAAAAAEKAKKDNEAAEMAKVAAETNSMMANLHVAEVAAPETRDGFKILITNKIAIAEIFTFWFQREGMTLTIAECEKKSITQMKAYCEKLAHKTGEKIESVNLSYEPTYKAVNRK